MHLNSHQLGQCGMTLRIILCNEEGRSRICPSFSNCSFKDELNNCLYSNYFLSTLGKIASPRKMAIMATLQTWSWMAVMVVRMLYNYHPPVPQHLSQLQFMTRTPWLGYVNYSVVEGSSENHQKRHLCFSSYQSNTVAWMNCIREQGTLFPQESFEDGPTKQTRFAQKQLSK